MEVSQTARLALGMITILAAISIFVWFAVLVILWPSDHGGRGVLFAITGAFISLVLTLRFGMMDSLVVLVGIGTLFGLRSMKDSQLKAQL
jgi:hypothetical protein